MDPWKTESNICLGSDNNLSFEDNFDPEIRNYTALEDSKEYLDSLGKSQATFISKIK